MKQFISLKSGTDRLTISSSLKFEVQENWHYFSVIQHGETVATADFHNTYRPIISGDKPEYKLVKDGGYYTTDSKHGEKGQMLITNVESFKLGCGSILIDCIIKWAKWKESKVIWLDVLKNNSKAIHLYQKFGFVIDEEYDKYNRMEVKRNTGLLSDFRGETEIINYYRMYLILN